MKYLTAVDKNKSLEERLLFLLSHSDRPLSADCLSVILCVPVDRVIHELRRLERWKIVRLMTARSVSFWATVSDKTEADLSGGPPEQRPAPILRETKS